MSPSSNPSRPMPAALPVFPPLSAVLAASRTAVRRLVFFVAAVMPLASPALAQNAAPIQVPEWVQPGAQVVYHSRTTGPGGTTAYYSVLDVLAVLPEGVLVSSATLNDFSGQNLGIHIGSAGVMLISELDIVGGMSFFMRPESLATLRTSDGVLIGREPAYRLLNGNAYDAITRSMASRRTTLFVDPNDPQPNVARERESSSTGDAFEVNSGIKITELIRQADSTTIHGRNGNSDFNHTRMASGSLSQLQNYRQLQGPWQNQRWPQWTQTVRRISYAGTISQPVTTATLDPRTGQPGVGQQTFSTALQSTYEIQRRGDGWVQGVAQQSIQDPNTGQWQGGQAAFVESIHQLGGIWMSPQTLANLPNGLLDREPVTGSTVHVEADVNTVNLTHRTQGGDWMTTYYDRRTGLAQRIVGEIGAVTRQTIDLRLQGQE